MDGVWLAASGIGTGTVSDTKAIPYDAGIIRFFREKTVSIHPYVTFFV